jgi:hypothetical protein
MSQAKTQSLNPEAARRFSAMGRREVERRMIECSFPPAEDEQAKLWLHALRSWKERQAGGL